MSQHTSTADVAPPKNGAESETVAPEATEKLTTNGKSTTETKKVDIVSPTKHNAAAELVDEDDDDADNVDEADEKDDDDDDASNEAPEAAVATKTTKRGASDAHEPKNGAAAETAANGNAAKSATTDEPSPKKVRAEVETTEAVVTSETKA